MISNEEKRHLNRYIERAHDNNKSEDSDYFKTVDNIIAALVVIKTVLERLE